MAKITTQDIAFTVEAIAHLKEDLPLPTRRHLLIAAAVLRNTTDDQLAAAIDAALEQKLGTFYAETALRAWRAK